jgi:hypothetical protein
VVVENKAGLKGPAIGVITSEDILEEIIQVNQQTTTTTTFKGNGVVVRSGVEGGGL